MASPLSALETGLETLLGSITYTKQSGGTANVPYISSRDVTSYKHYPIVRLDDLDLEHDECKDLKGWEASIILEIITSTQPGHGSDYDVNKIEEAIDLLMKGGTLTVAGFNVADVTFDSSLVDRGYRTISDNPKAKPQRVISRDVAYTIWINE